jgi:hypothetical protein
MMVKHSISEFPELIGTRRNLISGPYGIDAIGECGLYEPGPLPIVPRIGKTRPKTEAEFADKVIFGDRLVLVDQRSLGLLNLLVLAIVKKSDTMCQPLIVATCVPDGLM